MEDPLIEKQKNEASKLTRRRQAASDTSRDIVKRREEFFYKLALINGGALTFSITLLGSIATKSPHGKWVLLAAWLLLLLSLATSLSRNLTHQHYQMADALADMAQSEIAYTDVDHEIVNTRAVMYSDSAGPFDKQREVAINRSNREKWKRTYEDQHKKAERHWHLVVASEWISCTAIVLGFGFLVAFAIRNL